MTDPTQRQKTAALLWSGGKDSAVALHAVRADSGLEVVSLVITRRSGSVLWLYSSQAIGPGDEFTLRVNGVDYADVTVTKATRGALDHLTLAVKTTRAFPEGQWTVHLVRKKSPLLLAAR